MRNDHMNFDILKRIGLYTLIVLLCLQGICISASGFAEQDPLVSFGVTTSKDDQYIPVFDSLDSGKRIDLLKPDQLCALDYMSLQGKYYWYRIVYLDDYGDACAGYVKESNYKQLKASELALYITVPENAIIISQLIAQQENPQLFLGTGQTAEIDAEENSTTEAKKDYILNTNTHKFHLPGCKSVKQMKEKNKKPYTGTRQSIIDMGYSPCKNCNP